MRRHSGTARRSRSTGAPCPPPSDPAGGGDPASPSSSSQASTRLPGPPSAEPEAPEQSGAQAAGGTVQGPSHCSLNYSAKGLVSEKDCQGKRKLGTSFPRITQAPGESPALCSWDVAPRGGQAPRPGPCSSRCGSTWAQAWFWKGGRRSGPLTWSPGTSRPGHLCWATLAVVTGEVRGLSSPGSDGTEPRFTRD